MIRTILPFVLCLALCGAAYGQNDTAQVQVQVITEKNKERVQVGVNRHVFEKTTKRKNVTTQWMSGVDAGVANFVDKTNYPVAKAAAGTTANWFDLRNGKSVNVNIWFFSQKINLINHNLNLKYVLGLELNNYRFKNPVRFTESAPYRYWDHTAERTYTKSKLAADYVNFPVMLNIDFGKSNTVARKIVNTKITHKSDSREWGISAGISAGYLYSGRNKTITSDEGKKKLKDHFDLNPWKISYVAEVNLGYIGLYGLYATKSIFKNGINITPYNVGLRFSID